MVLDLIQQLIPYAIVIVILFFLWLAMKNHNRLKRIKHTGRVSEIIDRRRNFVFYITLSALATIGLLIYLIN